MKKMENNMKKDFVRKKTSLLIACIMLAAVLLTCMTGCAANRGGQSSLEATEEELKSSPELRRIGIQTIAAIQVNTTTAAIGFYFAGENEFIGSENEKYETIAYTLTAYDEAGNELKGDDFAYEMGDKGVITVTVKKLGRVDIYVESTLTDYTAEASVSVVRQSMSVWDIIILGIGLYVLFLGITGKGKVYEAEFVKEGMELNYKRLIRICCIIISICMIASGIIAAADGYGKLKLYKTIVFVIAVVFFIAGMIAAGNMTDKQARKEAEEKRMGGRDLKAPNAAFEFDDDEPTIDDIKKM